MDVSQETRELQEWLMARRKIGEALRLEYQRLEHNPPQEIEVMVYQTIEHFKDQQKIVNEKIQTIVKQSPFFFQKHNLLTQEKGIGDFIAATLIAELSELGKCSPQQSCSYWCCSSHS